MVSSTFFGSLQTMRQKLLPAVALASVAGLSVVASGCLDRELKPLNPCLVSGVVDKISVQNVDKVDLLFVVDNSGSMREEQAALRVQFPRLITTLTTGVRGDGTTFPAVRNLNLGVVSTDMGLPGVPNRAGLGCGDDSRPLGDDGVLRNAPNPGGDPGLSCQSGYPPFLSFMLTQDMATNQANAAAIANNFACISSLGTTGCGFEMQLEATLRALWPSDNILPGNMPGPAVFADGRPFIDNTMSGKGGPAGPNNGFLRNNVNEGLSLIAVIIVSDEEDCSSHNMGHFVPENFLQNGDPLKLVALNLRCYNEATRLGAYPAGDIARDMGNANLYGTTRYVQGLKALRPNNDNLVIFAGIVGLPTDLVDRQAQIDFTNQQARDGYYDSLLADSRIQENPDPNTLTGNPNLIPSCLRNVPGSDVPQRAFPPRRFIKVAKEFGENATLQSICSDDFTPAVNQIIDIIARQLGSVCLPRKLTPDSDGLVSCDVVWELPLPNTAPSSTPTSCSQRADILSPPAADRKQVSADGRPLCVVNQVAVKPCSGGASCVNGFTPNQDQGQVDSNGNPLHINGWYYDDFSNEVANCPAADKQRIAFTNNPGVDAQPPSGVTVRLECLQQAASVTVPREDVLTGMDIPSIGSGCVTHTDCHVPLSTTTDCDLQLPYRSLNGLCYDTQMFCHPKQRVCAAACANKSECLPGFECDGRPETTRDTGDGINPDSGPKICVNPTCGD